MKDRAWAIQSRPNVVLLADGIACAEYDDLRIRFGKVDLVCEYF